MRLAGLLCSSGNAPVSCGINRALPKFTQSRPALAGHKEVAFYVDRFPPPAPSTPSPVLPGGYTPRERFIRLPEVLYTTGLSRSTVYEMMSRRQFPAQVSLGGKNVAWLASEVEQWMDERIANRHQEAAA